jgi:hypothetical protein
MALSKYINDDDVFHLRMGRRGRNMLQTDNKITTKISVAIVGIFERYTCNINQQDAPHKDKINLLTLIILKARGFLWVIKFVLLG